MQEQYLFQLRDYVYLHSLFQDNGGLAHIYACIQTMRARADDVEE
jgi:hypothetical protein